MNIVMRHMKWPCVITVNSDAMSVLQTHVMNIQTTPGNVTIADAYVNLNSCFKQHKLVEEVHKKIPCNIHKCCEACSRIYTVGEKGKTHKCVPIRCRHCAQEIMDGKALHYQCYIQPMKREDLMKKKYKIFETRHHNGRHEAHFCCVKDTDGENMFCFTG